MAGFANFQTYGEMFFDNYSDFTQVSFAGSGAEASLLTGSNEQPSVPANVLNTVGRSFSFYAAGILGSNATPNYTFTVRFGTAQASLAGTTLLATAALTTASGVANKKWEMWGDFITTIRGIGSGNATLNCTGTILSGGGLATTQSAYAMTPGGGESATWTATFDASVTNYFQLSVASSATNASNVVTCKMLKMFGDW